MPEDWDEEIESGVSSIAISQKQNDNFYSPNVNGDMTDSHRDGGGGGSTGFGGRGFGRGKRGGFRGSFERYKTQIYPLSN